ncbi:MAG TPA: YfhO family protein, partial [Methylococcus sp.]|nr:YfhO family protein [Methylococcus sp.]
VLAGAALVPASATGAAMAGVCTELQRRVGAEDGRVLALHGALPANLGARLGVEDLRSYDPMRPRTLAFLHHALGSEGLDLPGPIMRPWAAIAGAWGVRWLVTPPSGVGCARWAAGWEEVYRDDSGALYRNRRALPILRLATTAVTPPGEAAEGDWEGLDFATTAVMDQPLRLGGSGEIALLERRPWRVVAHVRAAGPVLAVLHVPRTSGWGVRIDGRPAPLLTANLAALAVVVPDGAHEIRFSYAPAGLLSGTVLTAVGLAGCALLARRREWR